MYYLKTVSVILTAVFFAHSSFAHEGHDEVYTGCELAEEKVTIQNNKCVMMVKDCQKHGNKIQIPEGHAIQATCDAVPQLTRDLPLRAGCPTEPNECANDTFGDDRASYKGSITWIVTVADGNWLAGATFKRENTSTESGNNNENVENDSQ